LDPDLALLRQYVSRGDQPAFEAIVRRYVDLVYSAALRHMRDQHRAEDVTQAVFVLLARKAGSLSDGVLLGGWLVNAARLVANQLLRSEQRRAKYERQAAAMRSEEDAGRAETRHIGEVLDTALSRLGQTSRGVLVMQYLEGRSGREIAEALDITEEAARKRVSRALEELRGVFARRGIALSADALAAGLIHAKVTAPAGLAAASAAATSGTGAASVLAKATVATMTAGLVKSAAGVAFAVTVLLAATAGVSVLLLQDDPPANRAAAQNAPAATATELPATIEGVVISALGNPVAGARVMLSTEQERVNIYEQPPGGTPITVTDANGHFALRRRGEPDSVVVRADEGFADVSWGQIVKDGGRVHATLKTWARVNGVLMIGPNPVSEAVVKLWKIREMESGFGSWYVHDLTTRTDATGQFEFPQVMSGEVWLQHEKRSQSIDDGSRWEYAVLDPGETRSIQVGGTGRPVIGKAQLAPDAVGKVVWANQGNRKFSCTIYRVSAADEAQPKWRPGDTREQYEAELEKWGRTPAGHRKQQWRTLCGGTLQPDGSFRFEDIEPGKYDVHIRALQHLEEVNFLMIIAQGFMQIEVPDMPGGRSDEPLDVGALEVKVLKHLMPGEPAPELLVTTFDGQKWELAAQSGKPVIVLFWSCRWPDKLKEYKTTIDALTADGRVAVIGVSCDQDEKLARETAAKLGITWPLAQAAEGNEILDRFDTAPTGVVVIGADGTVVQNHIHQARLLKKFVDRALAAR
jgi:RNA polymerase sigma factor (sigma-70 family)